MLVEDFLEFDRKELTFNRLIFRYYKPWWKIFSLGLTIFGFALVGIALVIKVSTWLTAAIFIGGCVIGYVGIRYSHAQTRKVIKKQYSRMLNKHEQWDYKTVAKIRVDKMRAWVDKDITDYKLQTVLTAVQRKKPCTKI
jgi:hypothetical protein